MYVPYLATSDYLPVIQREQLHDQILDELIDGIRERRFSESWAMGKIRSKIGDQYDFSYEFTPTLPFDSTKIYGAEDRIILDYPEWVSGTEYKADISFVTLDELAYRCIADNSDSDFDEGKWISIGFKGDIYHIALPFPRFSMRVRTPYGSNREGVYDKGDKVWWNGRIYSAIAPTRSVSQEDLINYASYAAYGYLNVFPDDLKQKGYWKDEGPYQITTGDPPFLPLPPDTPPTWVIGDNRDPLFVQAVVDLSLWMLHKRIAPMNIPKIRTESMNLTFDWLNGISQGTETTGIVEIQPSQGGSLSWGSAPKNRNTY